MGVHRYRKRHSVQQCMQRRNRQLAWFSHRSVQENTTDKPVISTIRWGGLSCRGKPMKALASMAVNFKTQSSPLKRQQVLEQKGGWHNAQLVLVKPGPKERPVSGASTEDNAHFVLGYN